ncbi:MAG: ornithine carbamoyltransferase [Lentisphaeria bacterium]|nr:ornithine carbamoyltransferase [Lentisphaeria bacterium]
MDLKKLGLHGKSILKLLDLTDEQVQGMIELAEELKARKKSGANLKDALLYRKNIALIFQKSSTRTHCATVCGVHDEGGYTEYLNAHDLHFGKKESVKDSARVLGRMFDGIMFRGYSQRTVEDLAKYSGIPVWNGLTDEWHPSQVFADFLTIKEHFGTLKGLKMAFIGDGRNNVASSLMIGCSKVGMDFVDVCPQELSPSQELLDMANEGAKRNGCKIEVSHDPIKGVEGANILYTDVWVSMGEEALFNERLALLKPFQVNMDMVKNTGLLEQNKVIFLHCLPAFHDNNTEVSKETGAMEVSDDVFEAPFSKVFDEAENRLHTIKAMIVASLA